MPSKFLIIRWDILQRAVCAIAHHIPFGIRMYGIPRGGDIIASLLEYLRPDLERLYSMPGIILPDSKPIVIVDDISDTGHTLAPYRANNHLLATAFVREGSETLPEFGGVTLRTDAWLVFPWEMETLELPKA